MNNSNLADFTDICDEIDNSQESQPMSLSFEDSQINNHVVNIGETSCVELNKETHVSRPPKGTGQYGQFRSIDEIDVKYRRAFSYPFFNLVQSGVIEDAIYSDTSMVICAPTGSGKTVVFEMAIVQLLMEMEDKHYTEDFKIIYMAPVKALCTERLTEWYPKFTKLGLMCIEVTGDTDVDFSQLKPYRLIITTPEKWDMVTRRWREHRQLVEVIKLFLIDEVHILNDETRGPVLEAVVSRMKTIESSAQSAHRIEQLQKQYQGIEVTSKESPPKIRFVAVSATVSNPEDVAAWLGTTDKPAVYYKFGDESRPVKLKRIVEGYHCPEGTSIFKFDIILNYKLWSIIQKYHNGKPTLIFCNTRKSVALTADTLSRELTVSFSPEQKAKLAALASTIKNKKLQALVLSGVGCHHAGLLFEERTNIEQAFRNRDLPILITTTTLAMGVNLPAHLVIIKNTQQYVNGGYQEYSISTILQMVGRAGRPQFDTEATAVIMTRLCDKPRYQSLVGGSEPLQSYLHKRLAENLNSEAALGTVNDVAQCVQWLRSTFLCVRAARDPKRYLGLPQAAPEQLISNKIEELCVKAMNGLATSGLITMDEASCIESTEAGRLMSVFYLDLETMKHIMKINGTESLERLLWVICESHELADMHLRVDERRSLNLLNRNKEAATIRFPMKGKINTRQMKLNCIIQAILGCLNIPDPSLNQEAMKIMRTAVRVCKCLVAYVTRPAITSQQPKQYSAVLNALVLSKCVAAHLWENSQFVSKQLKGIGPTFSTLLASAGKVNFMLLEESHPRDLERIMNKGPPAGNVLCKQISLLPKYQITATPIDEKSVTIELVLLNHNYLSENVENLTAGDTHKSYVIVGDSENNLLLLMSFKDKDLISVYNGTITQQITRKHSFEHKIYAKCISSSYVGIDSHCEYSFKDFESPHISTNTDLTKKPENKQTAVTDTFKERKRKSTSENDVTQSKEKKKRVSVLFEKFKYLKESFGKTSKQVKEDLDKSAVMSNRILEELTELQEPTKSTEFEEINKSNTEHKMKIGIDKNNTMQEINTEVIESDNFMDDERFNNILNEIENEISMGNHSSDLPRVNLGSTNNKQHMQCSFFAESSSTNVPQRNKKLGIESYKTFNKTNKCIQKNNKSNYNFIDLLEKNMNLSDEEEKIVPDKKSGFSDTIKSQIEKYIQCTKNSSKVPGISIMELIQVDDNKETVEKENYDTSDNDFQITTQVPGTETIECSKYNETAFDLQNHVDVNLIKNGEKEVEGTNPTPNKYDHIQDIIESENHDIYSTVSDVINDNNNKCTTNIIDLINKVEKEVEESNSTAKQGDHNIQDVIESETHDIYRTVSAAINNTCNSTIIVNQNCGSDLSTTYYDYTEKPHYIHNSKHIDTNDDSTCLQGNNFKIHDLIIYKDANKLVPKTTQDINSQLNPNYHSHKETIPKTNIKESLSTNILALPYIQSQPLTYSENPAHTETVGKEISLYSTNDIHLKSNYPRFNPATNSMTEPFATSSENSHNNYKNQSNENINVRNYSYSTTQIDVATRNAHIVQVIRKIKMDLNITEIISEDNTENNRLREIEDDSKVEGKCNVENRIIDFKFPVNNRFKPPEVHTQDIEMKNAIIAYKRRRVNNEVTQDDNQGVYKKQTSEASELTPPSPQFKLQCEQIQEIECDSDRKVNYDKDNIANEKTDKINISPQKEGNRFENIVQKYSKRMRKTNTGNLSQSLTQPKVMNKGVPKTPSEKPKRSFKITDIHNSNIPLPKTLVSETCKRENVVESFFDTSKVTKVQNEMILSNTYQEVEPENSYFQDYLELQESWEDFNTKQSGYKNEDIDNFEEVPNYDAPDIAIEVLDPQCTEVDFNIDNSMFNPKTLLQCLSKDDPDDIIPSHSESGDENYLINPKTLLQCFSKEHHEDIIPPPAEFCDENVAIITKLIDRTVPTDSYEPIMWDDVYENNNQTKENIFQDESHVELTPRKEIETWTLSQNDESHVDLAATTSFSPTQSFTIMHNSGQRRSPFQNVSVARQNKLGQFKFCYKKKYLPKI